LLCSIRFDVFQGLAANTTNAQLKRFSHLTSVPYKVSQAQCETYARAKTPADGKPIADASLWCPYAEMDYGVEVLPNSFVEVRSLELMPRMRYKLWFEDAGMFDTSSCSCLIPLHRAWHASITTCFCLDHLGACPYT
jgi:hypothetical protein